jgi:diguanylate cyclase (GGDEF)-like protein
MNPHYDVRAELQSLEQAFQLRLDDDLDDLVAMVSAVDAPATGLPVAPLLAALHRLVGAAGTFGEGALGEAARAIEQQLKAVSGRPLTADECRRIRAAVVRLPEHRRGPVGTLEGHTAVAGGNRNRRVWVLEDDEQVCAMLVNALRSFGYAAQGASTVAAIQDAVRAAPPDALIVDIDLGADQPDGLEALAMLQTGFAAPVPALVVTHHDDHATRLRAVRAGAVGFFAKPVDLPQLESRLELCFDDFRGEPLRVVAVDDDPLLLQRYAALLGAAGMQVHTVNAPDALVPLLDDVAPDLLLLDVEMPGCSGPELAQMVRLDARWVGLPIIFVSAETDLDRQADAIVRGGDDFMTKPIHDDRLVSTVLSRARRARALANALSRDSLTGVLKHGSAKEQLEQALARCARAAVPCAVAMIDLDHFKTVNDQHGHATGDRVLRSVGALLRNRLRREDVVGRYGGEEFLIALPGMDAAAAAAKLDGLRAAFGEIGFLADGGQSLHCTFSVGVSDNRQHATADAVLQAADAALYRAKGDGRNRVCVATTGSASAA